MNTGDQLELARHLGVSDRRVRQLEAEQIIERLDGELVRYDLNACARRYRMYADGDIDAICRNIEEASADIDAMLERMRNEPYIQKRREIAKQDGGAIGRLDVAMKVAIVLQPEHSRGMARTFNNLYQIALSRPFGATAGSIMYLFSLPLIIGRAAGDFFELCNWRLDTAAEDFQAPILQPQADLP